jgi:hypothetical protein
MSIYEFAYESPDFIVDNYMFKFFTIMNNFVYLCIIKRRHLIHKLRRYKRCSK